MSAKKLKSAPKKTKKVDAAPTEQNEAMTEEQLRQMFDESVKEHGIIGALYNMNRHITHFMAMTEHNVKAICKHIGLPVNATPQDGVEA